MVKRKTRVTQKNKASKKNVAKKPVVKKNKTKRSGRKMNAFMKTLLDAKKKELPTFKYKGKTFKRHVGTKKNPSFVFYKKA